MTSAVGYGRISSSRNDGASLDIQHKDYQSWCAARGHHDGGWFQDDGVSGGKVDRQGLDAALAQCAKLGGAVLVARDLSRIGRSVKLLGKLADAMDSGAVKEIATTHDAQIGTGSQGRLILTLLMGIAESQRTETSERMKRRLQHNRSLGLAHTGGSRPFGTLADKTTPVPEEVAKIREAIDYVNAGGSLSSLATRWRAEGLKTTTGRDWQYQSLWALLTNERLDALVGESALTARLAIEARKKTQGKRPRTLTRWLNGTLKCGVCGELLDSHSYGGGTAYGCTRIGGKSCVFVDAPKAEDLFGRFVRHVALPGVRPDQSYGKVLAERKEVQEQITRVTDLYVEGTITKADHAKRLADLKETLELVDAELLTHSASAAMAGSVDVWDTLDPQQRRSVVLELLGTAVVNKHTGKRNAKGQSVFDPARFTFLRPEVQMWFEAWCKRQ